ncbi:MAG: trimethylamine corrinoid protein 2 [Clostridiales bacterium]|nr:MAG: trimethylamine corrinoid protein 2 [Clostridiales bacterium]
MKYKDDWDQAKKRLEAFWNGEITDRCCVAATGLRTGHTYKEFPLPETEEGRKQYWTDAETIIKRNVNQFENTYYGGEAFPQIFTNLGASGIAGYIKGVRTEYRDSIWFFPAENVTTDDPESLIFDKESFLYRKTLELTKAFCEHSKGDYFVSVPDISGNLDTLEHVRGGNNFLMDLIMAPDWIHAVMPKLLEAYKTTTDECYEIYKENNEGGSSIGWLNIWAPGKFSQMQCDLSVMISNDMFNEFAVPELKAQAAYLDKALYHFDGIEQINHLDSLLAIDDIDIIQWTSVSGQPEPTEFIPVLKKMQAAGKKLLIYNFKLDVFETLLKELSSKGLFLLGMMETEEEARELVKLAEKYTHE